MIDINIENVVVSAQVLKNADLDKISRSLPDSEYNPDEFPGVSVFLDKYNAAAIILSSGKVVCTGAKSISSAKDAMNDIVKMLKEKGFEANEKIDIVVQNMVASADLKREVNVEKLAETTGFEYEPERFPGLVYRNSGISVILFKSGKIVCTGGRGEEDIKKSIDRVIMKI